MSCERNDEYEKPDICTGEFSLNENDCTRNDSNFMESVVAENIEIGGTCINVFKLLGIHEQGKLIDLTGDGAPISSPSAPGFLNSNAFNDLGDVWQSFATGQDVIDNPAFIGYNFGTKKTSFDTERYAPSQPKRMQITTLTIKQGALPENRVTVARIEASDDGGVTWKRIDVVEFPDNDINNTISVKASSKYQMWRIIPLQFNGVSSNSPWIVDEIEMMDYQQTSIKNVQDQFFNENRDREYANMSIDIKATYDMVESSTDFSRFGIELPEQYVLQLSFARMIELLDRPIVIGDIIEIPAEQQYDVDLKAVKKYLEVTDTTWSATGYTPNWRPTIYRVTAEPLIASRKTESVVSRHTDEILPDDDFLSGQIQTFDLARKSDEHIRQEVKEMTPETGDDMSEIANKSDAHPDFPEIYDNKFGYSQDGMPPNGEQYTEGPQMPQSPADGDYHRLTYPQSTNIPVKLFKFNGVKNRWIFQESDLRREPSSHRPSVNEQLSDPNRINNND